MKIYTLGMHGSVSGQTALAVALGLNGSHRQAGVLVCARSKAAAYVRLAELGLEPGSVNDKEFKVAYAPDVADIAAAGVLVEGTVLVKKLSGASPVVRVDARNTGVVVGQVMGGRFIPSGAAAATPAAVVAKVAAGDRAEEQEIVLARLASTTLLLNELEEKIARTRSARYELCRRAVDELDLLDRAAAELDVTPARVYQLRDKALRERAGRGEFLPGTHVQVAFPGTSSYPTAVVVNRPSDWWGHDGSEWVFVQYDGNGCVTPVRARDLSYAPPSCSARHDIPAVGR